LADGGFTLSVPKRVNPPSANCCSLLTQQMQNMMSLQLLNICATSSWLMVRLLFLEQKVTLI